MVINLYQAEVEHQEYERRVNAFLAERAMLEARAARSATVAHLVNQGGRLLARLATTGWCRGRRMLQQLLWTSPALDERTC